MKYEERVYVYCILPTVANAHSECAVLYCAVCY